MSEAGDYDPGPWRGYDFNSARKVYDRHVSRSYDDAKVARGGKKATSADCVPKNVTTKSASPLVIACDVTGSMGDWPATIFSKLPYLDLEGKEYLGDDMEICFAAIGDYFSDDYPLQVQDFCSGKGMEDCLKKLVIEGNGGGTKQESYELAAMYFANNVSMDNAIRPIFIFIGDEGFYEWLDKEGAKDWANAEYQGRMSGKAALEELQKKFAVYLIRKPYGSRAYSSSNDRSDDDKKIHKQWAKVLGEDHISELPDASRVVDVIFGILAKETGRLDYFKTEIEDRQRPDQVEVVMESLVSIHKLPGGDSMKKLPGPEVSVTRRNEDDDSKLNKSVSLLD